MKKTTKAVPHIQIGKLVLTPYKTFGKKQLKLIHNNENLLLINVFGFGIWYLKSYTPQEVYDMFHVKH